MTTQNKKVSPLIIVLIVLFVAVMIIGVLHPSSGTKTSWTQAWPFLKAFILIVVVIGITDRIISFIKSKTTHTNYFESPDSTFWFFSLILSVLSIVLLIVASMLISLPEFYYLFALYIGIAQLIWAVSGIFILIKGMRNKLGALRNTMAILPTICLSLPVLLRFTDLTMIIPFIVTGALSGYLLFKDSKPIFWIASIISLIGLVTLFGFAVI